MNELYPIVPYYVMVAISNYEKIEDQYSSNNNTSFPLTYYTFHENLDQSLEGVEEIPEVMKYFSELFGPYPFQNEKYAMTELGYYGAIENQTNTITNNMSKDWFQVSVHELAHMWFGDMITCKSWNHAWLNEGFATYSEALWIEHKYGFPAYQNYMENLSYKGSGTIYLGNDLNPSNVFIPIIYRKGAYFLHMLRGVLGDSKFFEAIYKYSNSEKFKYKNAVTSDFQLICEELYGSDLDYFFEQWIYGEYFPSYSVNWNYIGLNDYNYKVDLTINQELNLKPQFFKMPIEISINTIKGPQYFKVFNSQKTQNFSFIVNEIPNDIALDPKNWILKDSVIINNLTVLPVTTRLEQNYPNPFNSNTIIKYSISEPGFVELNLYDILGRKITNLIEKEQKPGEYKFSFTSDGFTNPLSNGVYFYKLTSGKFSKTCKMVLLK